jgi:hypothetical protein
MVPGKRIEPSTIQLTAERTTSVPLILKRKTPGGMPRLHLSKKPHGVNRRALNEGNNPALEQKYHRFGKSK